MSIKLKFILSIIVIFVIFNFIFAVRENILFQKEIPRIHPFLQSQPFKDDSEFHINSFGFRGKTIKKEKSENVLRIFIIGGSTVYSDRTPYENSHPRILEKLLQAKYPEFSIEVLNAGYHWYTTQHSLINYMFRIRDFDPDIIIMWHGINDLCRSFSPPEFAKGQFQRDYSHYYGAMANLVFEHKKIKPPIAFSKFKNWIRNKVFGKYHKFPYRREVKIEHFSSLESFRKNINLFIRLTQIDGVKLILATQPTLYKKDLNSEEKEKIVFPKVFCHNIDSMPNNDSMFYGMKLYNDSTKEIAQNNKIELIDLEKKFPKELQYFIDDCHYTQKGHQLIARLLYEFLINNNTITKE